MCTDVIHIYENKIGIPFTWCRFPCRYHVLVWKSYRNIYLTDTIKEWWRKTPHCQSCVYSHEYKTNTKIISKVDTYIKDRLSFTRIQHWWYWIGSYWSHHLYNHNNRLSGNTSYFKSTQIWMEKMELNETWTELWMK